MHQKKKFFRNCEDTEQLHFPKKEPSDRFTNRMAFYLSLPIIYSSRRQFNLFWGSSPVKHRHMERAIRSSTNRMALHLSIWSFTLIIPFHDYFSGIGSSFLVRCRRTFFWYPTFIFPLDLSSTPETFVCLFLVDGYILQHLLSFVNSFLKIYFFFFI